MTDRGGKWDQPSSVLQESPRVGDSSWRLPEACLRAFPTVHKATKYLPLNPISTKDILNPCTRNQQKFRNLAADFPLKIPLGPGLSSFPEPHVSPSLWARFV